MAVNIHLRNLAVLVTISRQPNYGQNVGITPMKRLLYVIHAVRDSQYAIHILKNTSKIGIAILPTKFMSKRQIKTTEIAPWKRQKNNTVWNEPFLWRFCTSKKDIKTPIQFLLKTGGITP